MSSKRKRTAVLQVKKPGKARAKRRGYELEAQLPQGVTPAEKRAALEALAKLHGIQPIDDPTMMTATFWPPDETAEQIVSAIRALRHEGKR